ncbi:MAG: hypothetical protein IPL42_00500 [Saprospiraceae bacterium]|nr:hypothetical protein [Saprospiraceae bacterium]
MNKVKALSIICIGLLAANIILIWFLVSNKPPQHAKEGSKKEIIEKLGFDENQISEYEKLIAWHKGEIKKSNQQMIELKHKLYETLTANETATGKDSLLTEIGNLQIVLENIHYKHFQDIKKLCKPEQQKAFDAFTLEITNLFPRTQNRQH